MCHDEEQYAAARASAYALEEILGKEVRTEITLGKPVYAAEDYHQKYRLRRHSTLFAALVEHFGSEKAALRSKEAAKLNAYAAGSLVGDLAELALPSSIASRIPGKIRQSA